MLPAIVDSTRDRRRARPRCPARRRSPRCSATSRPSLVGQGCVHHGDAKITFGTGGMLDLDARRRRAAASRCAGRTARSRSSRGAHDGRTTCGHRSGHARGRHQRAVAARRPRGHRLGRRSRTSSRRTMRRHRRRRVRARAARTRHAAMGLRRARRAVRSHARHRRARDVVRAVLEGIAHRGADLVEAAEADAGVAIPTLRVDGGMTDNPTFVQALADASQRPVEISPVREATALGAALMAGLAVGHHDVRRRPRRARGCHGARVEPRRNTRSRAVARGRAAHAHWIPALSGIDF